MSTKTHDSANAEPELCGIEFTSRRHFKEFLRLNPMLQNTTRLIAKHRVMIAVMLADFPTRDVKEFQDSAGRAIGKFIGPDALRWTYQIRLTEPGEEGGYHPEAFQ